MCTVSYLPPTPQRGFIFTSNRDEVAHRPTLPPAQYLYRGVWLVYPQDEKAGGSWIAINGTGKLCCLLNGGFDAHTRQAHQTHSRGTVLLDCCASDTDAHRFFVGQNLQRVEPFTLIAVDSASSGAVNGLKAFVWDGEQKHYHHLDQNSPYIWSSATLYNPEQRQLRNNWFNAFCGGNPGKPSPSDAYNFHSGEHHNDATVNVVMQRPGNMKTVSITQVVPIAGKLHMQYNDLLTHTVHKLTL